MGDMRDVDHRDYTDPRQLADNDLKRPGAAIWLVGAIIVIGAIIGIYYSLMSEPMKTASNMSAPGAQSSINSPPPQPPSERQAPPTSRQGNPTVSPP